ncbi:hypothetical protein OC844_004176 [Tilletia horrida]|nr:hypothetical protein OC844_004176 [Tilletia horrida]
MAAYQQPHDAFIHSNASQYDDRYQQGAYRDDDQPSHAYAMQPFAGADANADAGTDRQSFHSTAKLAPAGLEGGGMTPDAAPGQYQYSDAHWVPPINGAGGMAVGRVSGVQQSKQYPGRSRTPVSKWTKVGVPVALIIIVAAIIGGVVAWKLTNNTSINQAAVSSAGANGSPSERVSGYPDNVLQAAAAAASKGGGDHLAFLGTDVYGNPSYLATANSAKPSAGGIEPGGCAADPENPSMTTPRSHPRLFAPKYQWDCLAGRISHDAYLTIWDYSIMQNASNYFSLPPTNYSIDGGFGGSGILDVSREVQVRVKAFAYAFRRTGDPKWVNRTWTELQTAAGNTSTYFGQYAIQGYPNATSNTAPRWNPVHFLDVAEMTAAFAIGYDWLYDQWTSDQRAYIVDWIKQFGLTPGMEQYTTSQGWWAVANNNNGNWNCVCNSGLVLGALAILDDDTSGLASQILTTALPNMKAGCMQGAYDDGTWTETANYWYFGTNAQARAVSALTTATGSDQGLSAANANWSKTGLFHMFVGGMAGLYAYGDNGPNKYSTNANGMFLWARLYQQPMYALYQRDRADAAGDPLSMFWYDTTSKGGFWNGLALDNWFNNAQGNWASMRSSWTDFTGTYVGVKASNATGHQTHGDLDAGDFVIDALGTRWAGEYGSGDYLSAGYFSSEAQDSLRWEYFRKGTQGQNTLVINLQNQEASCLPQNTFGSTNVTQSDSIDFKPASTDAAYFVTDMSSAYGVASGSVKRGIRMLNARRQILLQDEISSAVTSSATNLQWRVQTNATITLSADNRTATLKIVNVIDPNAAYGPLITVLKQEQTMVVKLVDPTPPGVVFSIQPAPASRIYGTAPNQTQAGVIGDQMNLGVSVLAVEMDQAALSASSSGAQGPLTIAVLWQPQWGDLSAADSALPPQVVLDRWSVTSHN